MRVSIKVARYIPFEIKLVEIDGPQVDFEVNGLKIKALHAKHSVPCYAYIFELDRMRKFDKDKAIAKNVPMKSRRGRLQKAILSSLMVRYIHLMMCWVKAVKVLRWSMQQILDH